MAVFISGKTNIYYVRGEGIGSRKERYYSQLIVVLIRPTFTKSESMAKSREKTDDSVILSLSALVAFGEWEIALIYKSRKHSLSLWAA